jgi:hypothetical protein
MKVRDYYFAGRKVILNGGDLVRFCIDPWLDNAALCDSYPALFDICQGQDWTLERVIGSNCVIPFRRRLSPEMVVHWEYIVMHAKLNHKAGVPDAVSWRLNANGIYSTKSMYQFLERNLAGSHNKWIWKSKIPLKIKIFLWQIFQNAILTRDNLKKRKWLGSPVCSFCLHNETAQHLFFECSNARVVWGNLGSILGTNLCPSSHWQSLAWFYKFYPKGKKFHMVLLAAICWGIWNIRNKITFDKVMVRSPLVTISSVCSFLHYWAGLYGKEDGARIKSGADQMLQQAMILHSGSPMTGTPSPRMEMVLTSNGGV